VSIDKGVLYVVATPIGNRDDISIRAIEVLRSVDLIAAEDTRHSRPLLQHLGIGTPLQAVHEHNERQLVDRLLARLRAGEALALISDAGTPLISDPGFPLVRACHRQGIRVSPIPGPSAAVTALSAAGLPTDRFRFEGFPARTATARREQFERLKDDTMTIVFYESSHRIAASLADMARVLGPERPAVLARELTKLHETIIHATLGELCDRVGREPDQRKGEFVVLVGGGQQDPAQLSPDTERILRVLIAQLPVKQAASLAARITGEKKNRLYQLALEWRSGASP
jgi:16S rRNA (cytidine1402-2'-O)-methyltransferase